MKICHKLCPRHRGVDKAANISCERIHPIGTAVYDYSANHEKDLAEKLIASSNGWGFVCVPLGSAANTLVTGISWPDYAAGKRGKFPSFKTQEEMLVLWPFLFNGYLYDLRTLQPGWTGVMDDGRKSRVSRMRFDEAVLEKLTVGEYVDALYHQ